MFRCLLLLIVFSGSAFSQIRPALPASLAVDDPQFAWMMGNALDAPLTHGNRIEELVNGDRFFPAMLQAIARAEKSITMENFVWRPGQASDRLIEALSERARAGVKVHFVIDAMGSIKMRKKDWRPLQEAGVEIRKYNPPRWTQLFRIGHRTHRKTMVVDGKIGFLGGISVADQWLGDASRPELWRDSNYRIEGPMVAQLQEVFLENWRESGGQDLTGTGYFPTLESRGKINGACFKNGRGEGAETGRFLYMQAIASARKNIRFGHSYFLPNDRAIEALLEARRRGVKIEVLTPGVVSLNFVRRASRARWRRLLEAGVEFYEYQPSRYHCKLLVVDDFLVSSGSINFDERSFRINDEVNWLVLDSVWAANQIAQFEADKSKAKRVELAEFNQRPRSEKWREKMLSWFRRWL